MTASIAAVPRARRTSRPVRVAAVGLRTVALVLGFFVVMALLWEGYKALGQATGDHLLGVRLPVATDDRTLPHVADIFRALGGPASGQSGQTLFLYYLDQASVTVREAVYGLAAAVVVSVIVAVPVAGSGLVRRALYPWLVVSQTIPLIALVPVIVVSFGQAGLPTWISICFVSTYVSFFPITVSLIAGLRSPQPLQVELMSALAASRWRTLIHLRIPAALPLFFGGLRVAAIASLVGALVGELSAGTGIGIGRAVLTASYYFGVAPLNLFAVVLVTSIVGILFVQVVAVLEALALKNRRK
jgi:NitT/TauT family transport system permease protein